MKPQMIATDYGRHNREMDKTLKRIKENSQWKRLDCVMIIPAGGTVPTKCAAAWMDMYAPPNNKFYRLWALGQEVGEAYSNAIENILAHPELGKWKYAITLEHDNVPPPNGIVRLLEQMEAHPEFSCIGGLYFTKGEGGVAQIWGDPKDPQLNFRPQPPVPGKLVECCGTGMGFNAWRLDMFRDKRLRKPWFKTQKENGVSTQDLWFWQDARQYGYRCAVDCTLPVGHYSLEEDIVW